MTESGDRHLDLTFGPGRVRPSRNFEARLTEKYGDVPFLDRRGSKFFRQANKRKNLGPDLARQRQHSRDDGEKRKAVANTLHKKQKAPALIPSTTFPGRAKRQSSASFEMKHRLLATFLVSVS